MASGNFFYRLERTSKNDNIEAISISLNMLAEEIQENMLHQGYANLNNIIIDIIQMSFIINQDGLIDMANQQASNILSSLHGSIIGKPFTDYLVEKSKHIWVETWHKLTQKQCEDTSIKLTFKAKDHLTLPKICYLSTFKSKNNSQNKTLLTVILHTNSQNLLENELKQHVIQFSNKQKQASKEVSSNQRKSKIRLNHDDIRKIRKGHDMIINHLEKDFPSLKDFALELGTNEFKLKYGFKELYGTSVYRFLMEERLRKSKMMIQYTDHSLKSIAYKTGFKSMAHFSRTFKKRYEYTPSALRKKSLNKDI
ncbi:helix-turn-helix domain-containing protein [Thalassobellus citreus]|uniref:helix-turn-helix domain-containing protein n=1 Tax=Thalassobellus citreus TaxID=3367752 RepID=UPI003F6DE3F6